MDEASHIIEPERSALMSRVRGKDTAPELVVRRFLHRLGYRYRLHSRGLPGSPDLVFPKRRAVLFVHGCFWHRHPGCRRASDPKTRPEFWQAKFRRNVARDAAVEAELERQGWKVVVVWECETLQRDDALADRLAMLLGPASMPGPRPRSPAVVGEAQ